MGKREISITDDATVERLTSTVAIPVTLIKLNYCKGQTTAVGLGNCDSVMGMILIYMDVYFPARWIKNNTLDEPGQSSVDSKLPETSPSMQI
jgi:hypothetical protein